MARPPTELGLLIGNKDATGIFKTLQNNHCLNDEASRDRKAIVKALALKMAYPPSGWRASGVDERGLPSGPMVPEFGGRSLYDELLDVLSPYLNEHGQQLAQTMAVPSTRRKVWWQIWEKDRD